MLNVFYLQFSPTLFRYILLELIAFGQFAATCADNYCSKLFSKTLLFPERFRLCGGEFLAAPRMVMFNFRF